MPLYQAIILALVQAFTEFLPVSSTAHLTLFPRLLGWADPGLAFDVALHAGTLVAVLLYFFKDWLTLTLCGLGLKYPANAPSEEVAQHKKLFWFMVIGTIPGGLLGALFEKTIEERFRTPYVIAISLIVIALVMWWADSKSRLERPHRAVEHRRCRYHRRRASAGAMPRCISLGHHHHCGPLSRLHPPGGHQVFFPPFDAAHRRRGCFSSAKAHQAAQSGRTGPPDFDSAHQHPGFRRGRLFRDRLFPALSPNTHAQSIYFLPAAVWYHRFGFSVPPGGCAIAPTCPLHHSAFPKMLRRTLCVC